MKTKVGVIVLLFIEVVCLASYFFHGARRTSELENRALMTFDMVVRNPPAEDSIVYKATASERFEEALKDQLFGREWVTLHYVDYVAFLDNVYAKGKRAFANVLSADKSIRGRNDREVAIDYNRWPVYGLPRLPIFPMQNYTYSRIGNLSRFGNTDYIFDDPIINPPDSVQLTKHAAQIEHIHELYPNVKFYSYFVSSLNSTKWFDRQLEFDTPDYFELIAQSMPSYLRTSRLIYQDESDYERMFYKSDHHWCYNGFMQGYEDIYNMISEDYQLSPLRTPVKIWNFSDLYGVEYRGSRASNLQELYDGYDEFIVPEYDLGNRECYSIDLATRKEIPVTLCLWDTYKSGEMSKDRYYDHYICFYYSAIDKDGNDYSNEYYLIRNSDSNTGHNLLFVTDSTGRAIRDVLGSHFDTEIYLDYRNMSNIKVDDIIEKYNVDTILMNGLGAVWTGKEYSFHFTDGFGEE